MLGEALTGVRCETRRGERSGERALRCALGLGVFRRGSTLRTGEVLDSRALRRKGGGRCSGGERDDPADDDCNGKTGVD